MGQKVSAIHSVKSENYYEKGNAINEIWVGDVELLSRLPFGDSDLAQASWPIGGWPKIPWHNFIIPLKRRSSPFSGVVEENERPPLSNDVMASARPSVHLSRGKLIVTVTVLSLLFLVAVYMPVILRQHTPPYDWDIDIGKRKKQRKRITTRASIASISLLAALAITVLQFHLSTMIQHVFGARSAGFLILGAVWAIVNLVGLFFGVKAVTLLWLDWRDARRVAAADSMSPESPEKELPGILVSCLQRQRRS